MESKDALLPDGFASCSALVAFDKDLRRALELQALVRRFGEKEVNASKIQAARPQWSMIFSILSRARQS